MVFNVSGTIQQREFHIQAEDRVVYILSCESGEKLG